MNGRIVPCVAPDAAVLLLDWWVLKAWCWVSEPEHWCLLGWPFCLLSSCVVDGSPVSRDEKWCCCLSPSLSSCYLALHLHPSPTPPLPMHELPPLFSTLLQPFLSLSPSFPLPPLPLVLSFPAKRLAGVFSTVVTFNTECHHCFSRSLSSLPLTCLSLCPLLRLHTRLPHPPSSSCSEGLLDQVLCLEERLALIQLSSVCVWAVCVFCV